MCECDKCKVNILFLLTFLAHLKTIYENMRKYSVFSSILVLVCSAGFTNAFQGKYEAYNAQQPKQDNSVAAAAGNSDLTPSVVGRGSMTSGVIKNFFGVQNRAPAHDTPATPCNCSKYYFPSIGDGIIYRINHQRRQHEPILV